MSMQNGRPNPRRAAPANSNKRPAHSPFASRLPYDDQRFGRSARAEPGIQTGIDGNWNDQRRNVVWRRLLSFLRSRSDGAAFAHLAGELSAAKSGDRRAGSLWNFRARSSNRERLRIRNKCHRSRFHVRSIGEISTSAHWRIRRNIGTRFRRFRFPASIDAREMPAL